MGALASLCGLGLAIAAPDPPAAPTPVDPGLALIQGRCVGCHDTQFIFQVRRSAEAWSDLVNDMVSRGADLDEAEIAQVRAYLEKNWSPIPPR